MPHLIESRTKTVTSPASATTVATDLFRNLGQSEWWNLDCTLQGGTDGTLDITLQREVNGVFQDWIKLDQIADAASSFALSISPQEPGAQIILVGTGTSPLISDNSIANGHPGDVVRVVMTAGAGTTAGTAQVFNITPVSAPIITAAPHDPFSVTSMTLAAHWRQGSGLVRSGGDLTSWADEIGGIVFTHLSGTQTTYNYTTKRVVLASDTILRSGTNNDLRDLLGASNKFLLMYTSELLGTGANSFLFSTQGAADPDIFQLINDKAKYKDTDDRITHSRIASKQVLSLSHDGTDLELHRNKTSLGTSTIALDAGPGGFKIELGGSFSVAQEIAEISLYTSSAALMPLSEQAQLEDRALSLLG